MEYAALLQLVAVLLEIAVAVMAAVIASRKKKIYGWGIALTFALFVLFDVLRIFALPVPDTVHAVIFLVACLSMLYAIWLLYREG